MAAGCGLVTKDDDGIFVIDCHYVFIFLLGNECYINIGKQLLSLRFYDVKYVDPVEFLFSPLWARILC